MGKDKLLLTETKIANALTKKHYLVEAQHSGSGDYKVITKAERDLVLSHLPELAVEWALANGYHKSVLPDDFPLINRLTEIVASALSDNDIKPRVKEIFEAFKDNGYVKKAKDQSLPENPFSLHPESSYFAIVNQLLEEIKTGFIKVEEKE